MKKQQQQQRQLQQQATVLFALPRLSYFNKQNIRKTRNKKYENAFHAERFSLV